MSIRGTSSATQAMRCVYENGHPVIDNGSGIIHIVCHPGTSPGTSPGEYILLWDDVKSVFGSALYVRSEDVALPFLKGSDFKNLEPLRFATVPWVVLDVVVNESVKVTSPPLSALPTPPSQGLISKCVEEWASSVSSQYSALTCLVEKPRIMVEGECSSESEQDIQWEGRISGGSAKETKHQQRIQSEILASDDVSPVPLASLTPELAQTIGRAKSGAHFTRKRHMTSPVRRMTSPVRRPLRIRVEGESSSESEQDIQWEGRLSGEAAKMTRRQQRIRNEILVSEDVFPAPLTSFTLELAQTIARAKSGDHFAQETLGDMCMDGRVVPRNVQSAIDWYLKAESQGSRTAFDKKLRYICYSSLCETGECLIAIGRHRKAADQGDSTAQCNVGDLYVAAKEYTKAMTWFQKSAEQGYAYAQISIGNMYHQSLGVSQDYTEAMTWFKKAANQGSAIAQYDIGFMYYQGHGVSQDYPKAMSWFLKAAGQGYAIAQHSIGTMYYRGYGVFQDYTVAMTWFQKAANQGDVEAQYNIGLMYRQGLSVSQDFTEAIVWFRKAAGQGHNYAEHAAKDLEKGGYNVHGSKQPSVLYRVFLTTLGVTN